MTNTSNTKNVQWYIENKLTHQIHTSERKAFRACRRRWDWVYRDMYYPIVTAEPLEFGVAFHKAMEFYYEPRTWLAEHYVRRDLALVAFRRECEAQMKRYMKLNQDPDVEILQNYQNRIELGLNMIRYYCNEVAPGYDRGFTPVRVEVPFEVELTDPDTMEQLWCKCDQCWKRWWSSHQVRSEYILWLENVDKTVWTNEKAVNHHRAMWHGLPVTYGGRLDMLAQDTLGRYWIFDWKPETVDSPILTPNGWVRMGDLKIGDRVIGSDGKPTVVLGVYPKGQQEVYEVVFRDGTVVECSRDHAWYVKSTQFGKFSIKETHQLLNKPLYERYAVPIPSGPIEFEEKDNILELNPYVLGSLIGDGSFTTSVLKYSSQTGETVDLLRKYAANNIKFIDHRGFGGNSWQINGSWRSALKSLSLWGKKSGEKFIPQQYLFASIEDRVLLLQGLCDTDGNTGICRFTTTSKQLADDFRHLVWSLGGNANLNVTKERLHQNGITINVPQYGINYWLPNWIEPNQLERKQVGRVHRSKALHRGILGVRKTGVMKEMQCIRVEASDHLYMTNNFILTHNTTARMLDEDAEASFLTLDDQITCVPMNTKALTPSGWKTRNQLNVGDIILAYDQATKTNKWTKIEALHDYDNAELYEVHDKLKTFSAITTSNHRWIGERPSSNGKYAKIVDWEPTTETVGSYKSKSAIYVSAPSEVDGGLPISPDEAALIAWILTDGCLSLRGANGNQYQASIAQSEHKYANEIQDLIDRLGINHSVRKHTGSNLSNKPYRNWQLSQSAIKELWYRSGILGKSEGIDEFVLGLSAKARASFADVGIKAEGSVRINGNTIFCQNDGSIKEAFRLAYYLEGKRVSRGTSKNFAVRQTRPVADIRTLNVDKLEVLHKVWCPTTEYGTWVMRQGKQITITGNSYCWALAKIGIHVSGFVYVEIKKAYPQHPRVLDKKNKGRLVSTDRQFLTNEKLFMETVRHSDNDGWQMGLYDTYLEWLRTDGPRFTQRHQIHRNAHEIASAGNNISWEAMDMIGHPRVYPMPGRFSCNWCLFKQPCIGKNMAEDYTYTLDTMFEKKKYHYWEDQEPSTE